MQAAHLIAFNIAILGALISPGPAFLTILRTALARGRAAGLGCAVGLALAAVSWSALAIVGLTAVFTLVPWAFAVLKIGGAAYLIWLAITLWRQADQPVAMTTSGGRSPFRLGLLTNFANPKAVIFVAAIFTTVFPAMPQGGEAVLVLGNHLLLELLYYGGAVLMLTTQPARAAYVRMKRVFDRCAALVLGALALRVAV
ncbi:LysE family transporter [Pseudooceanicola sp.]|uniref:LysE family translocator n=1 Tax=Pseudooceanicola sp. TaxID=1914328 RepID=UPI00260D03FA|nr:LysE family transporter [Pseudooceanicola sp.]MDF1855436.1 LysE family transporter [Pseudooceanicola sp.]